MGAGNGVACRGSSIGDVDRWWRNRVGGGASGASSHGRGVDWLGDGARAVGDGQGGSLRDGVLLGTVGDDRGSRAVGGVGSHDLSDVGFIGPGRDAGGQRERRGSDNGETHLVVKVWLLDIYAWINAEVREREEAFGVWTGIEVVVSASE